MQVYEALKADNERAVCSTQISFQFTPENLHRCEKIDPTKPKSQREYVVCKCKYKTVKTNLYESEQSEQFINALFVRLYYVSMSVFLNIIRKKNTWNKWDIFMVYNIQENLG